VASSALSCVPDSGCRRPPNPAGCAIGDGGQAPRGGFQWRCTTHSPGDRSRPDSLDKSEEMPWLALNGMASDGRHPVMEWHKTAPIVSCDSRDFAKCVPRRAPRRESDCDAKITVSVTPETERFLPACHGIRHGHLSNRHRRFRPTTRLEIVSRGAAGGPTGLETNLVAERIAIESYKEAITYRGDRDPTTRRLFEEILASEEHHAEDLVDLLSDSANS
jgi:Ferritin-like domain